VWAFQRELGLARTRVSSQPAVGCRYARWIEGRWWERRVGLWPVVRERRAVVGRLDRYLAGTPMAGLGDNLERVGRRHGVSPYFIVGVAGKESSLGAAACGANPRNVWGLGACGRAWSPPYFGSWDDAIDYFARFVEGKTGVSRGWPSARTPWDFHGYCSGCEASWASGVTRFMSAMGAGTSVEYRP